MVCVLAAASVAIKICTNFQKCNFGQVKVWQIALNSPKYFSRQIKIHKKNFKSANLDREKFGKSV